LLHKALDRLKKEKKEKKKKEAVNDQFVVI